MNRVGTTYMDRFAHVYFCHSLGLKIRAVTHTKMNQIKDYCNALIRADREDGDVPTRLIALKEKLGEQETIPLKEYRWLTHTLKHFAPTGKHVVIINDIDIMLSPSNIRNGKAGAGSEEALLIVAEGLAKRGYRVTVICTTSPTAGYTLPSFNPRFYPTRGLDTLDMKVDVCLAWRNTRFFRYSALTGAPVISIQHDWFHAPFGVRALDAVGYMSKYQMDAFLAGIPGLKPLPNVVLGNGVDLTEFESRQPRVQTRCVYLAAYHRGLRGVLEAWPAVIKEHPDAELHIYYGRECWGLITQDEMNRLVSMMDQPGVKEMGRVSHGELAKAICQASFMVNVSSFKETYSIVTAKALAGGCIPIITNTIDSSIVPPSVQLIDHTAPDAVSQFKDQLVEMMNRAKAGDLEDLRAECQAWASEHLTWDASIDRYAQLIESVIS